MMSRAIGIVLGALVWAPLFKGYALANDLARDRDPVVLAGAALSGLLGAEPARVVGFRYQGGWIQFPVQVDERTVVDFSQIYNNPPPYSGFTILTYADASTFTGPDPDATFDADDELVFMAKDAGSIQATVPGPPGTVSGSGLELVVLNPLSATVGYVYLFRSDGSLDPGIGPDPVTYSFFLLPSGLPYKTQYNTQSGPNPENTFVTSANYSVHFSDRWICNETRITSPGATGVDILDRRKALFAPGSCTRSEQTFSNGEGALIVNRQGAVRTLRGYCGANSGPTTYRIHAFYEAREDILTALRVHAIPGIMDFFDYSPDAAGMTYRNDLNPAGVTIDGVPDLVTLGPIGWEMVTGSQGTLVMTGGVDTDISGFSYTSYYQDLSPAGGQCTGDNSEYGASGLRVASNIPNTDPALGAYNILEATRVIAYDGPNQDVAFAQARAMEAQNPLTATVAPYVPTTSVGGPAASAFRLTLGPQPIRSRARVSLTLPEAGALSLRVHDATGRLMAVLADGWWPAGSHDLMWNASGLRNGVYFVRASVAGQGERIASVVRIR